MRAARKPVVVRPRPLHALSIGTAVLSATALVHAANPTFWNVSTQTDFLKGDVSNLSIDSDGRVVLGPAPQAVHETTAPFLWVIVAGPDGALFAGSGNEGKVFRIDKAGNASTFFDAAELEVHALANAPGGGLYVGTSPDGKIYKVGPDGSATTFFDPDDKYIWVLTVDREGNVYAATGDKGVIYKITPDGKGTVFYRTRATHVTALLVDRGGELVAGTASPAKIFRISSQGKAFVLLDSPLGEIHTVRLDDKSNIYAAAVSAPTGRDDRPADSAPPTQASRPAAPVPTVTTEIVSMAIADATPVPPPVQPARREDRRATRGAVYRISPDGLWDQVWESTEDLPYDLSFDAAGALLIGTGNKGNIFRVTESPLRTTLLSGAAAQQITMFVRDSAAQTYFTTANPGKIFRLSSARAERGIYESEVRDASTVASWGVIRWRAVTPANTAVQISTRSGNSASPDETWSDWSPAYTRFDGDQILSPKARYLQWRAVLSGKQATPVLISVTAAYLQRNLKPQIASITVHPPGTIFQKPYSTGETEIAGFDENIADMRPSGQAAPPASPSSALPLGRRTYQKGLQTFVWKAEDANDDRLQYDVMYRREEETVWKTLKRALTDSIVVWDTTSVPDGTYTVKVVASDGLSNSPGTALSGELESVAFDIDNTPPVITVTGTQHANGRSVLAFTVRDDQASVQRVEYSLDADRWRLIYPNDGIADSRSEQYEVELENEATARSLIIRATDSMNNSATSLADTGQPANGR